MMRKREMMSAHSGVVCASSASVRWRIHVEGVVQGVGFRPFVHALATRSGLAGHVGNDNRGVAIEVEGTEAAVAHFLARLTREAPPLARVEGVAAEAIPPIGEDGFAIVESLAGGERQALISPDIATCDDCLREMFDPCNRRYLYPFTNCTNCGPRFTIARDVPYDRPRTTMAGFDMCPDCAREYHDPADRRFHAQPLACPACGPRLRLVDRFGAVETGDPIRRTAELLAADAIVAMKGLGGYHLAAAAHSEAAVSALRRRKHREDKPFAVMVPDLHAARGLASVSVAEERCLSSPQRPIVLLRRGSDARLADSVAGTNRFVGLMLPYTPLHHLLCRHFGKPFVLTSGNVSDEPIAYADDDAFERLSCTADVFLTHDRPIHIRTDDSVVRVFRDRETPVRRARGYAPAPLLLSREVDRPILACGAELKNTFCLVKHRYAFVSHHVGDLENYETLRAFTDGIEHFRRLFDVRPEIIAYDLHPEYLSTKYALEHEGVERIGVQHHHAHVASCLADNDHPGPVIGVAFDGLGYGTDGTMWGGEFLVADLHGFERVGYFEPVVMPGGVAAIRQPWRMAAAYLDEAYGGSIPEDLAVVLRNRRHWELVTRAARARVNSPTTSSVGRLFDAVAAILGVRDTVHYEGQAAAELEQLADPCERLAYRAIITPEIPYRVHGADLIRSVVNDLRSGVVPAAVAARFHNALSQSIVEICGTLRVSRGLSTVALSGGVFQNQVLLAGTVDGLEAHGFHVLTHSRVPPNDGGISFGQAAVAAARVREGLSTKGNAG